MPKKPRLEIIDAEIVDAPSCHDEGNGILETIKHDVATRPYDPFETSEIYEMPAAPLSKLMKGIEGLEDQTVLKRIEELTRAETVRVFQSGGEIIESRPLADNTTRLDALKVVAKLKGWDRQIVEVRHQHDIGRNVQAALTRAQKARLQLKGNPDGNATETEKTD